MKIRGIDIKRQKVSEDEIKVYANGYHVGNIFLGWLRLGGEGWTSHGEVRTFRTQKEAIERLLRKTNFNFFTEDDLINDMREMK
jgi:hypothetical protein